MLRARYFGKVFVVDCVVYLYGGCSNMGYTLFGGFEFYFELKFKYRVEADRPLKFIEKDPDRQLNRLPQQNS